VENVNLDINLLKNEYQKLYNYISSEDKKIIDEKVVKALVSRVYSMKIFDLVDFLGERDKNGSLKALDDVLNEDKNLLGLITLMHRMFKSMLYIKTDQGKGSVTDYLAANINMPPYFIGKMVNKYIKFSRNYSQEEIIKIIEMLNEYDIELRRSIIDNGKLIKLLIARITGMNIQD
jgi:DNA polymerase III delta subunit